MQDRLRSNQMQNTDPNHPDIYIKLMFQANESQAYGGYSYHKELSQKYSNTGQ